MVIDMRNINLGQGGNFVSGTTGFRIEGATANDGLGISVSNLGDINGDGIDDFIIGADEADPNSRTGAGAAYVIFGRAAGSTWPDIDLASSTDFISGTTGFRIEGAAANDDLGNAVSNLGDINGDGIDDFIIGAQNADPNSRSNAGAAYVIFGRADGWSDIDLASSTDFVSGTTGFRIEGAAAFDLLGFSVSNLGDINGDGIDDFIVGADEADPNSRSNSGAAYVIFGRAAGSAWPDIDLDSSTEFPSTTGFRIEGAAAGDNLGNAVSNLGDINGDGIDDFIVGADEATTNSRTDSGAAYVIFGRAGNTWSDIDLASSTDFVSGTTGFRIEGAANDDDLGNAVSNLGDINGDGIDDFIIGAQFADPNSRTGAGAAYVIFGRAAGSTWPDIDLASSADFVSGTTGFKIEGAAAGDQLGNAVSNLGDINGDGIDDFIVGADEATTNSRTDSGAAYVIFGRAGNTWSDIDLASSTDFVSGTTGFRIEGAAAFDDLGSAVSNLGDINGDGIDDFIIGARFAGPNSRFGSGAAYVIFGTCLPNDYELPSTITFNLNICTASANIVDANDISTNLTIESRLLSQSGQIDLSGSYTSLTLDGATLSANSFTGQGAAIDLSGASSLTFTGTNTLDAGSGYVLLPVQSAITGALPTVTGITCFDSAFVLTSDSLPAQCYSSNITINSETDDLTIIEDLRSLEGRIDLSDANGTITLTDSVLRADNFTGEGAAIDISNASSFICNNSTIDAGESGQINLPPMSQVTATDCTFVGDVSYAPESSDEASSLVNDFALCTIASIAGAVGLAL